MLRIGPKRRDHNRRWSSCLDVSVGDADIDCLNLASGCLSVDFVCVEAMLPLMSSVRTTFWCLRPIWFFASTMVRVANYYGDYGSSSRQTMSSFFYDFVSENDAGRHTQMRSGTKAFDQQDFHHSQTFAILASRYVVVHRMTLCSCWAANVRPLKIGPEVVH